MSIWSLALLVVHMAAHSTRAHVLSPEPTQPIKIWSNSQCVFEQPLLQLEFYSSRDGLGEFACPARQSILRDDRAAPRVEDDQSIWSFPPACTRVQGSINEELCVFTSIDKLSKHGYSIFTTPSIADTITKLPALRGCPEDDHICEEIIATSGIDQESGAWRTAEIPGKGIGMLAARDLKPGDIVTAYTPTFMAYLESELSTADRETWWKRAIEQLPESQRKLFLGLTYVFGDERIRIQDIVKANTFQIDVNGVNHLVIFPETSRLNHACNPNAQYVVHNDLLVHIVRVTRPIAEGEEITISYTSPLEPLDVRQQHLQHGFHFTCTCPRCADPDSDKTLELIKNLQDYLNDWSATSTASPEMAEELLQIHRDEGLEGFMDVAYGFAALAYNAVGDTKHALHFAREARQAMLMKDGRWAPNLRIWDEILRSPEEHWSFRRRL
ncbi:hypothetical protein ACN47E_002654 [Coniothyrium glycines]